MNSTFTKIAKSLLAVVLILFGLNKFFQFIPLPEMPKDAQSLMDSLKASGYILQVVGVLEIFIGLLLLFNKWVGFALVLLAPISANILLFHLFLDLPGIGGAVLVSFLNILLIYKCWPRFHSLFE
ncbi:MAG: DoxX protein [Flavobacteriaceae bacterium]|nr:DoxX protein [Flavobacteriaceae bacterium]